MHDDILDFGRDNYFYRAFLHGMSVTTWFHIMMFSFSWACFFWMGRIFFEKCLGVYHATSSKHWSTLCKLIFLVTFVVACNLLQLLIFELLDLLPPALRRFAWSTTFLILSMLLNIIIPFVGAVSIGRTLGLRRVLYVSLGVGNLIFCQIWFWIVAKTFITDKSESWKDHKSANVVEFIFCQLFFRDVQHSVALLAMMGTGIAAVVAGFTTVTFPIEQLLVMQGINKHIHDTGETRLIDLLSKIARVKRQIIVQTRRHYAPKNNLRTGTPQVLPEINNVSEVTSKKEYQMMHGKWRILLAEKIRVTCNRVAKFWSQLDSRFIKVLRAPVPMMHKRISAMAEGRYRNSSTSVLLHSYKSPVFESKYVGRGGVQESLYHDDSNTKNNILALEGAAKSAFRDVVNTFELQAQVEFSETISGRWLWIFGLFMSAVAV